MNNLISICIPTYQRPLLLQEAIASCLAQDYRPIEIIVADDSQDDLTENLIKQTVFDPDVKLRYVHNVPALGQAGNINKLFEMAEGDRLVLLHDDDLLLPDAITSLAKCWNLVPDLTAAYGKQYVISMQGEILQQQSEDLNQAYRRTKDDAGVQDLPLLAGLTQQFPNDGYMVMSALAKQIKWRSQQEVGNGCEFDFGLRFSAAAHKFYFLNQYTAKYRLTDISMSKSSNDDALIQRYLIVKSFPLPDNLQPLRQAILKQLAPTVASYYVRQGKRRETLKIYLSQDYPILKRFTPRGIYHLLAIFLPTVSRRNFLANNKISNVLQSHNSL